MDSISGWRAKGTCLNSERVLPKEGGANAASLLKPWPLHDIAASRALEVAHPEEGSVGLHADGLPPQPGLMQLAGLATAELALAIAPHAEVFWIACGPGNNGGDGMEAAVHLKRWGKTPVITQETATVRDNKPSPDAQRARQTALHAGVAFQAEPPAHFDLAIDALFGIGTLRPWSSTHARWIEHINTSGTPVLAVDLPSGLNANTGAAVPLHVQASHTLSLLTLKPGLFMGHGRDACGDIWFNGLGIAPGLTQASSTAHLLAPPPMQERAHASHKGSYGDVCVVGGAPGMAGAALLAGSAALYGGAGRVYLCGLDDAYPQHHLHQPELMVRPLADMPLEELTVVAGCGGGARIAGVLPILLDHAQHLLLDADALNAISQDAALQQLVRQRRAGSTILTPHPLEAARLLAGSTTQVQADRLKAVSELVHKFQCTVVLKGSGTVVQAPGTPPYINVTGSGNLATAGTGDVLAGLMGAYWARHTNALTAASLGIYRHGQVADTWKQQSGLALSAGRLARRL